jgi:hypothetical protein
VRKTKKSLRSFFITAKFVGLVISTPLTPKTPKSARSIAMLVAHDLV